MYDRAVLSNVPEVLTVKIVPIINALDSAKSALLVKDVLHFEDLVELLRTFESIIAIHISKWDFIGSEGISFFVTKLAT